MNASDARASITSNGYIGQIVTPSQMDWHLKAKERAARKLAAARKNNMPKSVLLIAPPKAPKPQPKQKPPVDKPLIPAFFSTSFWRMVKWEGEYCQFSGGSTEIVRERSMLEITLCVLKQYPDVRLADIKGSSRTRRVVSARHHVVHAIKTERPIFSLPQIGRWLGGRDHTTALHSFRQHQKLIDSKAAQEDV